MTDKEIFEHLLSKFGNHSRVADMLGYKTARSYRRIRERGVLPPVTRNLALRLIELEQPTEHSTPQSC